MIQRLQKKPENSEKSFFLFGPRATGKSTWMKQKFSEAIYFNLLDGEIRNRFLANPERLSNEIPPDYIHYIIIDEIQKVPELLNTIHRLIEDKKFKFAITGSSARSIRRKGVNLLAGRALTYFMHPMTAIELGNTFDLSFSIKYGCMPGIFNEKDPELYLKTYVQTYLTEEIREEALLRNYGNFLRFLETASFSQGSVININNIAMEASLKRREVEGYFEIIEDLLISFSLPVFQKRAKRQLAKHSKFYFFDCGVFRAMRPKGPLDIVEEIDGFALETLVFQQLRAVNDIFDLRYTFYYWRTKNNLEVDFILYGDNGLIAIEVKRNAIITSKHLRGLKEFSKDYPEAQLYCFYGGKQKLFIDNIICISLFDVFFQLPEILKTNSSTA